MTARLPTGSDVARLAGVSKSAVSRAFTGGVVSDEARERIMEAARVLKYRPNMTARSLTTSESKLIGLALTHLDNQFYPEVVQRLHEKLRRSGYRMVLFITRGEADLDPVLDELLGYRLDGVILASTSMAARVAAECQEAGVPVVMFNNVDMSGQTCGVCADNSGGAAQVGRFLLAAGHRNIGIITGLNESSTSIERTEGLRQALAGQGGVEIAEECGEYRFDGAMRATRALLSRRNPPDALFCVNDHMALGAIQAARELGLEPGRNISIVGFDNVSIAAWPAFSLTTMAQPAEAMFDCTVNDLLAQIAGRGPQGTTRRLKGELIVRGSSRWPADVIRTADGHGRWHG